MLSKMIARYNNIRKTRILKNQLFQSKKKYAVIGVGVHSLNNIYPILSHFRINLKYICTKQSKPDTTLLQLFPECCFTNELNDIIGDKEVAGVIVCSHPSSHFMILQQLLIGGKNVWIEKPPCQTLEELRQLKQSYQNSICKIGLQRRYWPANNLIINRRSSFKTYKYSFQFGSLPAMDIYTELFIHALDYSRFLFGDIQLNSFQTINYNDATTIQMHVSHNTISGLIELSTHGSWNDCKDEIQLNCASEILDIAYPFSIKSKKIPKRILGLPTERILKKADTTQKLFNATNLLLPVAETNTLTLQGFYGELKNFFDLVEDDDGAKVNKNDLPSLDNVYEIIEKLK